MSNRYWHDAVESALDDAEVKTTPDQLTAIVRDIAMAHDMYSESQGYLDIPNPLQAELADTKRLMQKQEEEAEEKRRKLLKNANQVIRDREDDIFRLQEQIRRGSSQ